MVTLIPMAQEDYASYLERSIREYAEDHVRNGNWQAEEALEKSRKQFMDLLPDGLQTKNEFIYSLVDESGEKIGILWVEVKMDATPRRAFGYDFWIKEELRGKGYGKQALAALDEVLKSMQVESMGLHVFGDNLNAQALYRKMGFEITGIHMRKKYK
ncbi:MAG: GNAT family N-acetyltransferase [Chloroflexota bacterium]